VIHGTRLVLFERRLRRAARAKADVEAGS